MLRQEKDRTVRDRKTSDGNMPTKSMLKRSEFAWFIQESVIHTNYCALRITTSQFKRGVSNMTDDGRTEAPRGSWHRIPERREGEKS